jgi:hypothetical protein
VPVRIMAVRVVGMDGRAGRPLASALTIGVPGGGLLLPTQYLRDRSAWEFPTVIAGKVEQGGTAAL